MVPLLFTVPESQGSLTHSYTSLYFRHPWCSIWSCTHRYCRSPASTYMVTCIDRFTRWPEVIPVPDITAETVATAFTTGCISHFGVPSQSPLIEDVSLSLNITGLFGIHRIRTTAYHPIANGMIERFHRQLKAALNAHPHPEHWVTSLPMVLLGIRSALKDDLHCTAAELVYGTSLRLPGDFFSPSPDSAADPASYVTRLKSTCSSYGQHLLVFHNDLLMSVQPCPPAHMSLLGGMPPRSHCSRLMIVHTKS